MPDATKDFLGSGWKFPPQLDARGRIALVHQEHDVEEAILMILRTQKGERPMRPQFGSDLHLLTFMPNDASTQGMACRYVREALAWWEPRIEVLDVTAEADPRDAGCMRISVSYRLLATNSERNLVFPFYVIPGEE
jgi:phage baseplate assembly protein W